jgi:hypothetical protein
MDPAAKANPTRKHQRTKYDAQLSPNASPLEKDKFSTTIALASLPATLKSLAENYYSKFVTLGIEILHLSKSKDQLANADFVPTSACNKFELTASARVKEEADDDFKALGERTEAQSSFTKAQLRLNCANSLTWTKTCHRGPPVAFLRLWHLHFDQSPQC